MTMLGAYTGNDPGDVLEFEEWLGRPVDFVRAHTGRASWADYDGSVGWIAGRFAALDKPILWNIPMFADQGSLEEAATGAYATHWIKAARVIQAARPSDPVIHIRVGEEFNGEWMPWAAEGREGTFIQAYRQFVDAFRSVSDRFAFEWNVNTDRDWDPSLAYPGDDYVDVIGMDFYYNVAWHPADPLKAWDHMVNQRYGLAWLEGFAASRGKPTAYSEWGVNSPDAAAYVAKASEWFDTHDVLYQSYWNSDAAFEGKLSDGRLPATAEAYLREFADVWPRGLKLIGTPGNDTLVGSGLADTMSGGAGNDTYVVDRAADIIREFAGGGADTVLSSAPSYVLPDHVENLTLTSFGGSAVGNALSNRMLGGRDRDRLDGAAGNDHLAGGLGNDVLTGGRGKDTFVFDTRLDKRKNVDTITDFTPKDDTIWLENKVFTKVGKGTPTKPVRLDSKMFWTGTKAHDKDDRIIYDKKSGALYYDADGTGKGVAVKFAQSKKGLTLADKDFLVI